jgi:rare lipoprotein A
MPDAEPRLESIRKGGPNKPYEALGRVYTPRTDDQPYTERGLASWYGRKFHGRPTSSGEIYDMYAMTAAHPTLPIPSYARVRNPANGREVIVRINDRGPFHRGRVIDLSYTAALKLDALDGVRKVEVERITYEDIRTGAWRREGPATTMLARAPEAADVPQPKAPDAAPSRQAEVTPASDTPPVSESAATAPAQRVGEEPTTVDATASAAVPATSAGVDTPVKAWGDITPENPPTRETTSAFSGFWLQLGVFRQRDGALDLRRRVANELGWLAPLLAIFDDRTVHRLQAGPYTSQSEARGAAERIRNSLRLVPVIVERR